MADEVDLLDARRAVGHARAREQRVDRPAALVDGGVDAGLVAEVDVDRLDALERDGRVVHHHDLGAEVLDELRRRRAHAGGAADDHRALAVVPECVCLHVLAPVAGPDVPMGIPGDGSGQATAPATSVPCRARRMCNKLCASDPRRVDERERMARRRQRHARHGATRSLGALHRRRMASCGAGRAQRAPP